MDYSLGGRTDDREQRYAAGESDHGTTYRTRTTLLDAVRAHAVQILDGSLEANKDTNPFLHGVPAILDALRSGQIECRVYDKNKFHAKAYITHAKLEVVGSQALVGSSNFTAPGLTKNIELNIQVQSAREVAQLQEWFEAHWNEAVVVTDSIVETISRHTHRYTPFDVYAKALQEYFRGHELTATEWDETRSKMFSRIDRYQQEAYRALMKIARQHGGAFLCDGVGLGKTFVGLMLIERLVLHEGKRVVLFAPKATKEGVWEPHLREWLPHIGGVGGNADFSNLAVFSHTDLGRKGDFPERFRRIAELADIVVIDEAHHFRTLVLTPVLDRALHTDSKNIHRFRQRQALAETAAFVDEHMASVRSFPDAFTLLTHSMQKTEGIDGPVCEFGVASGRSINHIAKLVPHETVFGVDSFDGLPEDWQGVMPKGTFRRKELPAVRDNVSLIRGLFADTLGSFLEDHAAPVKLLHVDCDFYSSMKTIFERLEARIQPGSVIVFDEYFNYAGRQQHEYKAFADLVQRTGWSFEYLGYCRYGSQLAVRIGPMESSKTG